MNYINSKIWNIKSGDTNSREAFQISNDLGISSILSTLLINRGYSTVEDVRAFLGKSTEILHDPFLLSGMDKGAKRILSAIENNEKISVYGDYDVDGVTSVSILYLYLEELGAKVDYYIPNRKGEGYGVSEQAVRRLYESGTSLIITVDTGVTALAEVNLAKELGVDFVITDHHECPQELPDAVAVINPKRRDSVYPFQHLAGVGVVFKLLCALETLRSNEGITCAVRKIAQKYADLTAIGTIADVMPVIDENRLIVSYGLGIIDGTDKIGLSSLVNLCRSNDTKSQKTKTRKKISSGFVGFTIAPRINAAGRISDASLAVELFLSKDRAEAEKLAIKLCDINKDRQLEENRIVESAQEKIEENGYDKGGVIILDDAEWNHGVIGIVSSRITEKYSLPSILVSFEGNEDPYDPEAIGKGSGRSVKGMNLVNALSSCSDLLEKFGGHELAAGLSVKRKNLCELRRRMSEYARSCFNGEEPVSTLDIDCVLSASDITKELANEISSLEPYGVSNLVPVFAMKNVRIDDIVPVGMNRHLKLILSKNGLSFVSMLFCTSGEDFEYNIGDEIDVAFNLEINEFMNVRTVQLNIKDVRLGENSFTEMEKGEAEYEASRNGEPIADAERVVPTREDCGAIYNFLSKEAREGNHSYTYIGLLNALRSRRKNQEIGYAKLKHIIKIFRELNIISIEENGEYAFEYRISYTKTKTNLEKSSILKRLKAFYPGK